MHAISKPVDSLTPPPHPPPFSPKFSIFQLPTSNQSFPPYCHETSHKGAQPRRSESEKVKRLTHQTRQPPPHSPSFYRKPFSVCIIFFLGSRSLHIIQIYLFLISKTCREPRAEEQKKNHKGWVPKTRHVGAMKKKHLDKVCECVCGGGVLFLWLQIRELGGLTEEREICLRVRKKHLPAS